MNVRVNHARGDDAPVALDPVVPCVSEILSEERLLQELARAFPERAFSEPTAVLDIAYRPHRGLSAAFEVTEAGVPRLVAVQSTQVIDAEVRALGGWDATAWEYPFDPALPSLAHLADTSAMSGVARWLVGAMRDVNVCIPVRYVPGDRCVVRAIGPDVDMLARHSARGDSRAAHARLTWLWESPNRAFDMPEPLGFDERLDARFEATIPGERADTSPVLGRSIPLDLLCAQLGALHRLSHDGVSPPLARMGVGAILGRVERTAARRLRAAFPHCTASLTRAITTLREATADLPAAMQVTLHGDLHAGNLLLDDDGPVLVGFDRPVIGDPAFDLATLAGSLFLAAMERGDSVAGVATTIEALPAAYSAATGSSIRGDTYAWHLAAAMVGWQAEACLEVLAPRADRLVATLIDTAHGVLRDGADAAVLRSFAD